MSAYYSPRMRYWFDQVCLVAGCALLGIHFGDWKLGLIASLITQALYGYNDKHEPVKLTLDVVGIGTARKESHGIPPRKQKTDITLN